MKKDFATLQSQFIEQHPDLEDRRKESQNQIGNTLLLIFVGLFVLLIIGAIWISIPAAIFLFIIYAIVVSVKKHKQIIAYKTYFDSVKAEFIEGILQLIDPSFKFHGGTIPIDDIKRTGLFTEKWLKTETLQGEDYFTGQYNGVKVQVSEIDFGYNESKKIDHFERSTLLIANFNKTLKAETYLIDPNFFIRKTNKGKTYSYSRVVSKPKGQKVTLENIDFEKCFKTLSSDEIETRYILSFAFMERLLKVRAMLSHNEKLYISFKDDKVSFLIRTKTVFEPNLSKKIETDQAFHRFYNEILELLKIIDILKLNSKIWKS